MRVPARRDQAAPFSRNQPKETPKKPGRPEGHAAALRPAPSQISETIDVPLQHCPGCGGPVALRGDEKSELRPLAHRALRRPVGGSLTPVSQWFALAPILQSVAGRYPQTGGQLNGKLGYASCAMAAPLTYRGDIIGVLYIDRPSARKPFTPAALQYLAAAGAQLGALIGDCLNKLSRSAAREGVAWLTLLRRL